MKKFLSSLFAVLMSFGMLGSVAFAAELPNEEAVAQSGIVVLSTFDDAKEELKDLCDQWSDASLATGFTEESWNNLQDLITEAYEKLENGEYNSENKVNDAIYAIEQAVAALEVGGHVHVERIVSEDPTCTEDGYVKSVCMGCEEELSSYTIDALGHDMVFVEAVEPGCEDGMMEHFECTRCGALFADEEGLEELDAEDLVLDAIGHLWGDPEVIEEPTCLEDGYAVVRCQKCGEIMEDMTSVLDALGHDIVFVEAVEPGCEDGMMEHFECTRCDALFADEEGLEELDAEDLAIDALGHLWGNAVTVEPTCTEDGYVLVRCQVCGDVIEEMSYAIPAVGHLWGDAVTVEPTCTEDGYVLVRCQVCGDVIEEMSYAIPAVGHIYGNPITIPATENEDGYVIVRCQVCGEIIEDMSYVLPALASEDENLEDDDEQFEAGMDNDQFEANDDDADLDDDDEEKESEKKADAELNNEEKDSELQDDQKDLEDEEDADLKEQSEEAEEKAEEAAAQNANESGDEILGVSEAVPAVASVVMMLAVMAMFGMAYIGSRKVLF